MAALFCKTQLRGFVRVELHLAGGAGCHGQIGGGLRCLSEQFPSEHLDGLYVGVDRTFSPFAYLNDIGE